MPRNYGQCEKATFGVQCTCESLTASKRKQWSAILCECASVPWRSHLLIGRCKSLKKRRHHNRTVTEKVPHATHAVRTDTQSCFKQRRERRKPLAQQQLTSTTPAPGHASYIPPHTSWVNTHTHTHTLKCWRPQCQQATDRKKAGERERERKEIRRGKHTLYKSLSLTGWGWGGGWERERQRAADEVIERISLRHHSELCNIQ